MKKEGLPEHYESIRKRFPALSESLENLGRTARESGPLDEKTTHLVQLAAAAAIGSEGSTHSHVRRAIEAGAEAAEVYHAVTLLVTTIGFPRAAAAVRWVDDVLGEGR